MIVLSQKKLQQLYYLENIYFYSSKLSNNNRIKCFLNNKVAAVFWLGTIMPNLYRIYNLL